MNTNLYTSATLSSETVGSLISAAEVSTPVVFRPTDAWVAPIELSDAQMRAIRLNSVLAEAIKFYIEVRLAARERSLYLKESVAHLIQLQMQEMLKSAIFELCGELAEGVANMASGAVQIYGATRTLSALKAQADKVKPQMQAESDALAEVKAAKNQVAELQKRGVPDAASEMQEAKTRLATAEARHQAKADELQRAWKAGLESHEVKRVEADAQKLHGCAAILKGLGDLLKGTMKYHAVQADAAQKLYDALKRSVEGSQQYAEDFERELKSLIDQSVDTSKTNVDRAYQMAMNLNNRG